MKKAIVVGANGYIGTRLSKSLAMEGVEVVALVDGKFPYDSLKNTDLINPVEFSLENIDDFYNRDDFEGVNVLFHLAWLGVNALYRNDSEVQAQNVMFSLKVMELANHYHVRRVVFPGSAAESSCGDGSITGDENPAPSDMYSASKVAARYVCRKYAALNNIDLIYCLITSIYGPGRNDNNLISYVISSLLKGEKPSTTRLEQKWDYIYIDDLIKALVLLGDKGVGGKIYPVGSGTHRQMREYVDIIRNIINPELTVGIGELPYKNPDKIDNQIMDISKLEVDTGFRPDYSFEEGIKIVIDEYKN